MAHTQPKQRTVSLFPTPLLVVQKLLTIAEIESARSYIYASACHQNNSSENLRHTEIFFEDLPQSFRSIKAALLPQVEIFACMLLGQKLKWSINGMWGNLGISGASQIRHNHANSIVSGIIYLTEEDQSGTTRFHRPQCDLSFSLENSNDDVTRNVFNASTWFLESVSPGDAILFPSFLTHHVPKVAGTDRLTVSFNAVPHQLDCSGYVIRFEQRG